MGDARVAVEDEEEADEFGHQGELVGPASVGPQGGDEVTETIVGDFDEGGQDEVDGVEQFGWLSSQQRLLYGHVRVNIAVVRLLVIGNWIG